MGSSTSSVGAAWGHRVVMAEAGSGSATRWLMRCSCGRESLVLARFIRAGMGLRCKSCYCSTASSRARRYWEMESSHQKRWIARYHKMRHRCEDPLDSSYERYGARGIYVAERFKDVAGFLRFIKTLPGWDNPSLSLDRKDNDGPYVPGNLRMATPKQQANNRRPRRWYKVPA